MAFPTYDGFSLQDDNFITEEIEYRTIPTRTLDTAKLARKPGVKLLSHDWGERKIRLSGHIVAADSVDLQSKIDALHANVTRKNEGYLAVAEDRIAMAVVSSLAIADPHYALDMVPFEMEFLLPDPFFYASSRTVIVPVTSGTVTQELTVTVSGSVFAEPSISYFTPSGTGNTTTSGVVVRYLPTGETVTWSGIAMRYSDTVLFDYGNQVITKDNAQVELSGVFSRWEPGDNAFVITYSGTAQGGYLQFTYQPRYL